VDVPLLACSTDLSGADQFEYAKFLSILMDFGGIDRLDVEAVVAMRSRWDDDRLEVHRVTNVKLHSRPLML
jgi:hypothetical protein